MTGVAPTVVGAIAGPDPVLATITPVEATLMLFVIATAVVTALARDVLAAIIVFGAYSLGMAALYTFYRAPDVAMTEAAISAGVTTILLLLTIAKTSRINYNVDFEPVNWPAAGAVGLLCLGMWLTLSEMPVIGDPESPVHQNEDVTQYYIMNAATETGVDNAVMAVLAGYRSFDTFGEAVVVFAAGIAAMLVLHREVFT